MSEHRGHLLPDTEDFLAARRGHCRTPHWPAAMHLPLATRHSYRAMNCGRGSAEIINAALHLTESLAGYRSHVGQVGGAPPGRQAGLTRRSR